ncbi:MAG: hypothetical protein FVQ84_04005 [Planctomycetes bacterium]|nr:hypothetical protein [Planctomycetota bacterium]
MTEPFNFSINKIADHMEKVGVDIRPVIEVKLDREKLYGFGSKLVEKYPNLFESLVQSLTEFRITKRFIFPGKGEAELNTLTITQRGLVLSFPRVVGAFEEEVSLSNVRDMTVDCLKIFRTIFPEKKMIRVGLVNEIIFDTGPIESIRLISDRFTKFSLSSDGEIRIRINRPTDDYNRIFELQALRTVEAIPEIPGKLQTKGYAIKVKADFNNRDISTELDDGRILSVLHDGDEFCSKNLYKFLNGSFGEE